MRSSLEKGGSCATLCLAKTHTSRMTLRDLVPAFRSGEEPRQSLRRDMGQRGARVCAGARLFDRGFADIGGENLERKCRFRLRPGIPSGRWRSNKPPRPWRTRAPRSELDPRGARFSTSAGNTLFFSSSKTAGSRKNAVTVIKTALAQRGCFLAILLEIPAVVFQRFESAEGHAALDAPRQGAVLVVREIHSGGDAHQPEYLGQFRIPGRLNRLPRLDRDTENLARWPPVAARSRPEAVQNPPRRRRWRFAACCRTWRLRIS